MNYEEISLSLNILIFFSIFIPFEVNAKLTKDYKSDIKSLSKELEKEGWKVLGGGSIQEGMGIYFEIQSNEKYLVAVGSAYKESSFDLAFQKASFQALMEIASNIYSDISQQRRIVTTVECKFMVQLNLLPIPIVILYRDSDGNYDCRIFYVLNKEDNNQPINYDDNMKLRINIDDSYKYEIEEE